MQTLEAAEVAQTFYHYSWGELDWVPHSWLLPGLALADILGWENSIPYKYIFQGIKTCITCVLLKTHNSYPWFFLRLALFSSPFSLQTHVLSFCDPQAKMPTLYIIKFPHSSSNSGQLLRRQYLNFKFPHEKNLTSLVLGSTAGLGDRWDLVNIHVTIRGWG